MELHDTPTSKLAEIKAISPAIDTLPMTSVNIRTNLRATSMMITDTDNDQLNY